MSGGEKQFGNVPNNLPVLACCTRRRNSPTSELRSTLSVHPRCSLLCVGGTGEDDICELSTKITVVTLVDDKCILGNGLGCELVGIEKVNEFGLGC